MMDIVKRLRGDYGVPVPFTTTPICHEAADEIERLRQQKAELLAEMERIANVSERWEDSLVSQINEIARAALAKATGGE